MIKDLIQKNRSFRRFDSQHRIERKILEELIELARLSPSAANLQPLRYILSSDPETNDLIFPCLAWAGYLEDWPGPDPTERPTAYIIILGDTRISKTFGCDHGIAAQNILLGAAEKGLGGCMIGSIQRNQLREILEIADDFQILLVIALGQPAEQVILEDTEPNGSIKYYRDEHNVHHVPKRPLDEIIIK